MSRWGTPRPAVGDVAGDRARLAVPVDDDRRPDATTTIAVALARQTGLGIEFVAAAADDVQRTQARGRARGAVRGGRQRRARRGSAGGSSPAGARRSRRT